jgi:hypothetical protein
VRKCSIRVPAQPLITSAFTSFAFFFFDVETAWSFLNDMSMTLVSDMARSKVIATPLQ